MRRSTYSPPGPFSQQPGPGLARILQPDQLGEGIGFPFSSYMPAAQACAWARDMAEAFGRPYRVVA